MHRNVTFPGGVKQTGVSGEARDAMIERQTKEPAHKKINSVHELIALYNAGRLSREKAYERYLELNDETEVTKEEMQKILYGKVYSKDARERMMRRKGCYNR